MKHDHWTTPPWFLDLVEQVGPIGLDPCCNDASETSKKEDCVGYYGHDCGDIDGLAGDWLSEIDTERPVCFLNPPYSDVASWVAKCALEASRGCEIIALIPASTQTKWMHRYVFGTAQALVWWKGRIKYGNAPAGVSNDAPKHNNVVVYWGNSLERFFEVFSEYGEPMFLNADKAMEVAA